MTGNNDDILNFREIFLFFWERKVIVISITFLSAILAFSYIKIFAKPFYISQSKLVVAEEYNQAKSLSNGALGGLAGLAGGILGGGSEVARGDLAVQTVKSKDFLEILMQDNYIYTSIFAASSYNPVTKVLTYDKIDKVRGLDITICTSASSNEEAIELLKYFNMPFPAEIKN